MSPSTTRLHVGQGTHRGALTVFPVWTDAPPAHRGYLTGDAEELGAQLAAYGHLGIGHILTNLYPFTEAAIDRYGKAVAAARRRTGPIG